MKNKLLSIIFILPLFTISQTFVSTLPENKNIILEEFTGISCGYCPDGHKIAKDLKDQYPNDVFLINIHSGSYASPQGAGTDFRTSFGTSISTQSGTCGYPAGTVNRRNFTSQGWNQTSSNCTATTAMSRGNWSQAAQLLLSENSPVNIGVQANVNMSTRLLTVDVEVYYTGNQTVSSNKLNIAVLQENVPGPQSGGSQYNPTAILPDGRYNHKHMLRHLMTGQYGVPITNIGAGEFYSNSFTWSIPNKLNGFTQSPEIDLTNLTIVAFVSEGNQEILNGTEIQPTVVFTNQFDANLSSVSAMDIVCANTNNLDVSFRNFGNQNLTSLDIEYSIGSGNIQTYNWSGNLAPGASESITINNVNFSPLVNNQVNVSLKNPNGNTDQNLNNNNSSTQFFHYQSYGIVSTGHSSGNCSFEIITDSDPSETTWEIVDDFGNVQSSGGPYTTTGPQPLKTFNLNSGCYSLYVYDSFGDGIVNGGYVLKDGNGIIIHEKNNFNSRKDQDYFEISSSTETNEKIINDLMLFPNPTNGLVNFSENIEEIKIYNNLGVLVFENKNKNKINLKNLSNGVYSAVLNLNKKSIRKSIIITK